MFTFYNNNLIYDNHRKDVNPYFIWSSATLGTPGKQYLWHTMKLEKVRAITVKIKNRSRQLLTTPTGISMSYSMSYSISHSTSVSSIKLTITFSPSNTVIFFTILKNKSISNSSIISAFSIILINYFALYLTKTFSLCNPSFHFSIK